MKHTPFMLEVIFHYHINATSEDFRDCPAFDELAPYLLEKGILKHSKTNERLYQPNRPAIECYLDAILSVPLPVLEWKIPSAEPI